MKARHLAVAAAIAAATLTGAIVLSQPAYAASVTATFSKDSDWGTGYQGKYTIANGTTATITAWTVAFDLPSGLTLGTFWEANLTTSGQHVTATNRSYNGTIAPGGSVAFGFIVNGGSGAPTNCTLNGAPCGGGSAPPPTTTPAGAPGTPTNVQVTGSTSSSISLAWSASSGTVTGYRVYEGTTVRATVSGTSATVGSLGACTSHTYTVAAYNGNGESAKSAAVTGSTTGCTSGGGKMAAPYLYEGWGDPPSVSTVMSATGIKQFTMAFMLSGGGCSPAWDGNRPLTGGVDQSVINQIRAGGGDVEISFGGWQGNKLGPNCSSASALAGAYQQVINAYGLKYIDIDIENTDEFENEAVQDRILGALKIVKQNNPGIKTIITFGTTTTGPNWWGTRLVNQSAALGANIDVFTIMPFDFGGGANMYGNTVTATDGLRNALKAAFGWSDATAYAHIGISGMNGLSDQQENTTPAIWTEIRDWANAHHIARLAFWSVNRDRPCAGGGVTSNCSGISQNNWQFTQITAGFTG
jgi:hypothetical protein